MKPLGSAFDNRDGDVTLLYAAKDRERNNAEALKRILAERL